MSLYVQAAKAIQLLNYYKFAGPFSPPNKLWVSIVDLPLKQITFNWSPVAPDCPAVHYNILASNCGSCPTTTNNATLTCTDVPTDGIVCTFAIQTVVCGNITGSESEPISIIFYTTEQTRASTDVQNSDTNTVYTISISSPATALIVCVVVSITVIVIILTRNKAKIKAAREPSNRAEREPMYEDVTGPIPLVSAINTQVNIAYGHVQTTTK